MQLLYSRAAPSPEFASLSLLLKADIAGDAVYSRMGEPLLMPSPVSTVSQTMCHQALKELHHYINSVFKASKSSLSKETPAGYAAGAADNVWATMFQEDEKLFDEMQVYRPLKGRGLGLHYRLIRDRSVVSKFIPLIFNASKATASAGKSVQNEVTGLVLCVGIAGLPSVIAMSSLHYSLSQRIRDSLYILSKVGTDDAGASRALLSTLLLTEDEDRLTNTMAEGANRTLLSDLDEGGDQGKKGKMHLLGKKKEEGHTTAETDAGAGFTTNSADLARIVVERLAVLSVAENDTIFRKYEAKANEDEKLSTKNRRKKIGRGDGDLDGFDFTGEKRSSLRESGGAPVAAAAPVLDTAAIPKSTSKIQLKQGKKDTSSRISQKPRQASVPALTASSKDMVGRNRRASMDTGVASNRTRTQNRRASTATNGKDSTSTWSSDNNSNNYNNNGSGGADGIHFPGMPESKSSSSRSGLHDGDSMGSGKTPPGSTSSGSRGNRNRQGNSFDPFAAAQSQSVGEGTATTASDSTVSSRKKGAFDEDQELGQIQEAENGFGSDMGFGEDIMDKSSRSLGADNGSEGGGPRVQVNIALNEDLTCFYKLSKMSSCSVEGVIQVQVKSNTQEGVPFFLLVRDPSNHIQSLQENKKFADNMAASLVNEPANSRPDHKFTVSVPKADSYFPVMRYKCGNDLRPVPIRVQTRVRFEDGHWRVALQISSNPHNEDSLTDLTIIMGVPTAVKGESLTTSPPGGVWNASKRSVIWCVSELGGGEKFQLQARFEVNPDEEDNSNGEKPKFPVLVRCQCMYAQLSDVEVEIQDIPEAFPAEVKMKLARRFRLSHRERP